MAGETIAFFTIIFLHIPDIFGLEKQQPFKTFLKQETANMVVEQEECSHHESDAHVVGLLDAVVLVRVLAEADEDGVDGHLKNRSNTFSKFYSAHQA